MEWIIDFPGGSRVDAHLGDYVVQTDQPPSASAPSPFDLFLASIGTCAGYYVLDFCRRRGLATDGLQVVQRTEKNPSSGMMEKISLEIRLPPGFPEKYRAAAINSAELCLVKKHLEHPPEFEITTGTA
jgi:putative redox protein